MKRVVSSILLLFCLIICSCEKDAPKDLLIGNWEVKISSVYTPTNPDGTNKYTATDYPVYYSFEKNGHGRYFKDGELPSVFSYKYNSKDNTIEYQIEDEKGVFKNVWFIDILTEEQLIFHEEYDYMTTLNIELHVSATYKGVRMK